MPEFEREALEGHWVHSHEEDGPGRLVFRPGSWNFPPSRGRRSLNLGAKGELLSAGPGPTDSTIEKHGRWRLLPGGIVELHPLDGQPTRMKLIELKADRLVVAR
jgi:hypothetical protein